MGRVFDMGEGNADFRNDEKVKKGTQWQWNKDNPSPVIMYGLNGKKGCVPLRSGERERNHRQYVPCLRPQKNKMYASLRGGIILERKRSPT